MTTGSKTKKFDYSSTFTIQNESITSTNNDNDTNTAISLTPSMNNTTMPLSNTALNSSPFGNHNGVFGPSSSTQQLQQPFSDFSNNHHQTSTSSNITDFGSMSEPQMFSDFSNNQQQTSSNSGSSGFGSMNQPQSSTFQSLNRSNTTQVSPFGQSYDNPFGNNTTTNQNNPFSSSGFGVNNNNSFGSNGNMNQTPFGSRHDKDQIRDNVSTNKDFKSPNRKICKFFKQGKCKYGKNCKFSHELETNSSSFSSRFVPPPNNNSNSFSSRFQPSPGATNPFVSNDYGFGSTGFRV